MPLMHTDPETDVAIATSLGITDLQVGRHYLRDEDRARVGAIWLDTVWMLRVQPTFGQRVLLGVATAHGEEFRGQSSSGWIKGFLASNYSFAIHDLESDPLPNVIARLPLLSKDGFGFRSRDGVCYQLRTKSMEIESTIEFANPEIPELVSVVRTCWELAETIARNSRDESLAAFTKTWERPIDPRR